MDPIRIALYENGLHPQAKLLYSILHAYAGDDGVAVVEESHITDIMRISPARLRGYRSTLNGSGYCNVTLRGTSLIFRMTSDHPTRDIARPTRENDHQVITHLVPDASPAPASDHLARDIARGARADAEPDAAATESARGARESDHLARDIARSTRAGGDNRGGRESERDPIPPPEKNSLTPSLPDAERKMSVTLLTDPAVGMSRFNAQRLAAQYPFEVIRAFACRWMDEGRKPVDEAGLIAYRLEAAETVPPLSHNELWQRHRTPKEITAEEVERAKSERLLALWRAEERTHQQPNPSPGPAPAPNREEQPFDRLRTPLEADLDDLWARVLANLALSTPALTFETWMRDTNLIDVKDGTCIIGTPHAYAREWLSNHLRLQIERSLNHLTNQPVTVQFVVRPIRVPCFHE